MEVSANQHLVICLLHEVRAKSSSRFTESEGDMEFCQHVIDRVCPLGSAEGEDDLLLLILLGLFVAILIQDTQQQLKEFIRLCLVLLLNGQLHNPNKAHK